MSTLSETLDKIRTCPEQLSFDEVMACIEAHYHYTACAFDNGSVHNEAGHNQGSCKIFAFAQLNHLSREQTLHCFGDYYRKDVLQNPAGQDHGNIRNFMQSGWPGITFHGQPLTAK